MPYCSNCGTQNTDGANFCANCGAALSQTATADPTTVSRHELHRGSKVSFLAADGKTYNGTVKKVRGERCLVQYDGYNSDAWVYRNQVNVAPGPRAVAVTADDPRVTYPRDYSTVPVTRRRSFGISVTALLGSLMIIAGFFTNWLNYKYGETTGWTLLSSARDMFRSPETNRTNIVLFFALGLIGLSAIICFLCAVGLPIRNSVFRFFKILPLLIILGFIAYILYVGRNSAGQFDLPVDSSVLRLLGIGCYLTLIGSLLLAVSGRRKSLS